MASRALPDLVGRLRLDTSDAERAQRVVRGIGEQASAGTAGVAEAQSRLAGLGNAAQAALRVTATGFAIATTAASGYAVSSAMVALRAGEMNVALQALAKANNVNVATLNDYVTAIRRQGIEIGVAQSLVAQFVQGHLDLAKAQGLARVAQDAAVISGQNSTETLAQLVEGIRTQQIEVLRSAGITVDAQGAYERYAKAHGIAAAAIDSTTKQQILLDEVLKQGITIQGAYAAALETPSKQLRSIPRLLNDISLNVGSAFLPAVGSVIHDAYELAKSLAVATLPGTPLAAVLVSVGAAASGVLAPVQALVPDVQSFLAGLNTERVKAVGDELQRLAPLLGIAAGAFAAMGVSELKALPIIGGFLPAISPVLGILAGLVATSPALQAAFALIGQQFAVFAQAAAPAVQQVLSTLATAIGSIALAVAPVLPVLASLVGTFVVELLPALISVLVPTAQLATTLVVDLAPALLSVLLGLRPMIPSVVELANAAVPLVVQVLLLAAGLVEWASRAGLLVPILVGLTAGWVLLNVAMVATKAIGIAAFLVEMVVQFYAAASAEGVLTAAQWLLNIALDANPIGLVVLGIAALIAIIVLAITHWGQIHGVITLVWNRMKEVGTFIAGPFVAAWNAVSAPVGAFFSAIGAGVSGGLAAIGGFFSAVGTVFNAVAGAIQAVLNVVTTIFLVVFAIWLGIWVTVFTTIWNLIQGPLQAIAAFVGGVMSAIGTVVSSQMQAAWGAIVAVWTAVSGFFGAIFSAIGATVGFWWSWITTTISNFLNLEWQGIQAIWNAIWGWIGVPLAGIWSTMESWWGRIWGTVTWWAGSIRDTVAGIWNSMVQVAEGVGGQIWGAIRGGLNEAIKVADVFITNARGFLHSFGVTALDSTWIPLLAQGAVISSPTLAVVGEGGPEVVVPVGAGKRGRGLELAARALEMLGVGPGLGGHGLGATSTTPGDWAGQCVVAVEGWTGHYFPVAMASQMAAYVNSPTPAPGEIFVSTLPPFGHTGIVIGANKVIDSNWGLDERVRIHNLSDIPDIVGYISGFPAAGLPGGVFDVSGALKGLATRAMSGLGGWPGQLAGGMLNLMIDGIVRRFDSGGRWPSGSLGVNASGDDEYVLTRGQMEAAGGRPLTVIVNGATLQPLDERRIINLLREQEWLAGA